MINNTESPQDSVRREIYRDERKLLIGIELEMAKSFDSLLTTLSAGALGLIFAFLQESAQQGGILMVPRERHILVVSSVGFCFALISSLCSLVFHQMSLKFRQKMLDDWFRTGKPYSSDVWNTVNNFTTVISILALFLGVILFAWFIWIKYTN